MAFFQKKVYFPKLRNVYLLFLFRPYEIRMSIMFDRFRKDSVLLSVFDEP